MSMRRSILVFVGVLLAGMLVREALEAAKPTLRPIYKSPLGLAIDKSSQFAYVVLQTADALAVVDLRNNKVLDEIPVGKKPYDVALRHGIAYVTCEADDTLVAVDVAERKVLRRFKVGQAPRGVAVDPHTGFIRVVCHDAKELWTLSPTGYAQQEPLPPQPEGNFARASTQLTLGDKPGYSFVPRPFGLFTGGQSINDPKPAKIDPNDPNTAREFLATLGPERTTAFNPVFEIEPSRTSMDMVAHTRARWFIPTAQAPEGRIFTNALSFFINNSSQAAVVLLDEPKKGYPDPTDVVVKLPRHLASMKSVPLAGNANAKMHPLNGARVFISSGGADTVIVLDLFKAAKHFEANPPSQQQMGGFQASVAAGAAAR